MEKRIIVSGGDELKGFGLPDRRLIQRIRLEGAGALCASGRQLFCACDWGDVIWRLETQRLVPTALFAGGPGMKGLLVSRDGQRLYALCGDADSLLALDAVSGAPMMVNRVGVNPRAMTLDESGEVLAVAGGECAQTVLLCPRTLNVLRQMPMPGMVYSVALRRGTVYSLCLNEALASTLATVSPGGTRETLALSGMPGALLIQGDTLLAATHERLYTISADGRRVLRMRDAAGRAERLIDDGGRLMLCDGQGEALFALETGSGRWSLVSENARDALILHT